MIKVTLHQRAITSLGCWDFQREIEVPAIFQGMKFYGVRFRPKGYDVTEDAAALDSNGPAALREMGWDQDQRKMVVYLNHNNYKETGEPDDQRYWTDKLVEEYQDWTIEGQAPVNAESLIRFNRR